MAESCNQAVGVTPTIKIGSVRTFMSKREREENKIKNYKIIFFLNYSLTVRLEITHMAGAKYRAKMSVQFTHN